MVWGGGLGFGDGVLVMGLIMWWLFGRRRILVAGCSGVELELGDGF